MNSFETKRLTIREWKEQDAPQLFRICQDPELRRNGLIFFETIAACSHMIANWIKLDGMWAIECKDDGCLIGFIFLGDMNRYPQYNELEYAIDKTYRKRGYAAEALVGILEYGFEKMNLEVIAAWVRSHNVGSARLLEKCFFLHEGTLRRHGRDMSDTLCYSITKEDWEKRLNAQ